MTCLTRNCSRKREPGYLRCGTCLSRFFTEAFSPKAGGVGLPLARDVSARLYSLKGAVE